MAKILNSKSDPASPASFSLISNEKLLAIYTSMVKCRMLEQRATLLFQQGKLTGDLHASLGREASAAAVGVDLRPEDTLCIAPGDWLSAFVKGMSLEGIFHLLAPADARADGCAAAEADQKNILVLLDTASLAKAACERAANALMQKKGVIVVIFIAPGTDSLRPWHKIMATAATRKLPIVFVRYVDQLSKAAKTRSKSGFRKPEATFHGLPAISVDALDPVATYRVAFEAVSRARQARGSTLLECTVHPILSAESTMRAEGQPGNETPLPDPVNVMEAYLKRKTIEPEAHKRHVIDSFFRDLDLAARFLDR
jgi:acetoin:2,6-dichlorophenolindophenol oxidoreductase subunit alpha